MCLAVRAPVAGVSSFGADGPAAPRSGCLCPFSSGSSPPVQRRRDHRAHKFRSKPAGARVWVLASPSRRTADNLRALRVWRPSPSPCGDARVSTYRGSFQTGPATIVPRHIPPLSLTDKRPWIITSDHRPREYVEQVTQVLNNSQHNNVAKILARYFCPAQVCGGHQHVACCSCGQERTLFYRCCPERRDRTSNAPHSCFDDDDNGHTWPGDPDFLSASDFSFLKNCFHFSIHSSVFKNSFDSFDPFS